MIVNFTKLSLKDSILKFLDLLNCIQPVEENKWAPSERDILAEFFCLDFDYEHIRFTSVGRRLVQESYSASNVKMTNQNLHNKLTNLITRGHLYRDEDNVIYAKPYLVKGVSAIKSAKRNNREFNINIKFGLNE